MVPTTVDNEAHKGKKKKTHTQCVVELINVVVYMYVCGCWYGYECGAGELGEEERQKKTKENSQCR